MFSRRGHGKARLFDSDRNAVLETVVCKKGDSLHLTRAVPVLGAEHAVPGAFKRPRLTRFLGKKSKCPKFHNDI